MERKYCTERGVFVLPVLLFLLIGVLIGVAVFMIVWKRWMTIILLLLLLVKLPEYCIKRLYYPVFSEDSMKLKHAVVDSWTKEFKYIDIDYAFLTFVNRKGIIVSIEFVDGTKPLSICLGMTSKYQLSELRAEFTSHNIPDMPLMEVNKASEIKEFRSKKKIGVAIMDFIMNITFTIVIYLHAVDLAAIFVAIFLASIGILFFLGVNYVILDNKGMEIRHICLPFMNVRVLYSDIETISFDDDLLTIILNDSALYGKRKVIRRGDCFNHRHFFSYLKNFLPLEKLSLCHRLPST